MSAFQMGDEDCPFIPIIDEKTGYRYYWNSLTNESVWEVDREMRDKIKKKQEVPKKIRFTKVRRLLRKDFYWTNFVITVIVNFGVTFAIEWYTLHRSGVINIYKRSVVSGACIAEDLPVTAFLLAFLIPLVDFFFNGDAVEKKKTRAIDKDKLRKGVWRLFPMTYHVFWRSLVLGIMFGAMYGGLSLAIFAAACTWGNSLCNVGFWGYTIFKACWACLGAALVHPLAFIGMCARERPVPVNKASNPSPYTDFDMNTNSGAVSMPPFVASAEKRSGTAPAQAATATALPVAALIPGASADVETGYSSL